MAVITLQIPDAALPRVVDALCARDQYDARKAAFLEENPGGTFPTRAAFAKGVIADFVRTVTRHYEAEASAASARVAALQKADSEVTIT